MTFSIDERDVFVDPVSHQSVDPDSFAGRSYYNGHMYYFTSRVNKDTFDDDPELWVPTPHCSLTSANLTPVADE
jgi:YHS domain-containing protein